MKNRIIIFLISSVLLAVGSWWFFFRTPTLKQPWELIPAHSVLSFELQSAAELKKLLHDKDIYNTFGQFPYPKRIAKYWGLADSLVFALNSSNIFAQQPIWASLHVWGQTESDFLLLTPMPTNGAAPALSISGLPKILRSLLDRFNADRLHYRIIQRKFNNRLLTEITELSTNQIFSFALIDQVLVGSFSGFLVEDAIRAADQATPNYISLQKESKSQNGQGIVTYINFKRLSALFTLLSPELSSFTTPLSSFASQAVLDQIPTKSKLIGTGKALAEPGTLLELFRNQPPARSSDIWQIIPGSTAFMLQYSGKSGPIMLEQMAAYRRKKQDPWQLLSDSMAQHAGIILENQYKWFGGQLIYCLLETINAQAQPAKLVFVSVKNPDLALESLEMLALKTDSGGFEETYREKKIGQILINELPALLFGTGFQGFENCFFAQISPDYIVFGDSPATLKILLDDLANDNILGRSPQMLSLLNELSPKANVRLLVCPNRLWSQASTQTQPAWSLLMRMYPAAFRSLQGLSASFLWQNGVCQMQTLVSLMPEKMAQKQQMTVKHETFFDYPLIQSPKVVPALARGHQVLVQDSGRSLHLVSEQGKRLFSYDLGQGFVLGTIAALRISATQMYYALATEEKIHLLEHDGQACKPFPISLPNNQKIGSFGLIAYDNGSTRRLAAVGQDRKAWLFDLQANALEGWQGKQLGNLSLGPPLAISVAGRDFIVFIGKNGLVEAFNRRGEPASGFPLNLKAQMQEPFFVQQGSSAASTTITALSKNGQLFCLNLAGLLLKSSQPYRPSVQANFRLCPEPLGKAYLIARQNGNRISLLDAKLHTIFEKDFTPQASLQVQYYHFGGANEFFAITELEPQRTFIFDRNGKSVRPEGIASSGPIGLMYSQSNQSFTLFRNFSRKTGVLSFSY